MKQSYQDMCGSLSRIEITQEQIKVSRLGRGGSDRGQILGWVAMPTPRTPIDKFVLPFAELNPMQSISKKSV